MRKDKPRPLATSQAHVVQYAGPLPQASELEAYERIQPGAAKIIIGMAQEHAAHQRLMELDSAKLQKQQQEINEKAMDAGIRFTNRNQFFAFIVVIICLGIGGISVIIKGNTMAFVLLLAEITGLAGLFIYSIRKGHSE